MVATQDALRKRFVTKVKSRFRVVKPIDMKEAPSPGQVEGYLQDSEPDIAQPLDGGIGWVHPCADALVASALHGTPLTEEEQRALEGTGFVYVDGQVYSVPLPPMSAAEDAAIG